MLASEKFARCEVVPVGQSAIGRLLEQDGGGKSGDRAEPGRWGIAAQGLGTWSKARSLSHGRTRGPYGVTLLEILLVLALLVVLAAVTWPALEPALASVELRKSAERIRVEWNQARVDALSTGRTVFFRYEPEANRYCVEYQPEPAFLAGGASGEDDAAQTAVEGQSREAALPERITFAQGEISDGAMDPAAAIAAAEGGEWSQPIVFYPDGSTSNAKLTLENQRGQSIELTLRGLTGVVGVGSVYSETEAAL